MDEGVKALGSQGLQMYSLPLPKHTAQYEDFDLLKETNYDILALSEEVDTNECRLAVEQKIAYNEILASIDSSLGQIYFLDAPGGTGKTFVINLLLAKVRSQKRIALASSGIAATLLEGGRLTLWTSVCC